MSEVLQPLDDILFRILSWVAFDHLQSLFSNMTLLVDRSKLMPGHSEAWVLCVKECGPVL